MKSIVYAFFSFLSPIWAFNFDLQSAVKHRGPPNSMFGFTVAQHSYENERWMLVGAPEDQTNQVKVTKGGAVYKCEVSRDYCSQVVFDKNGDNLDQNTSLPIDTKSNQWFGATLTTANGSVLACAPRYVYRQGFNRTALISPVGTCWLSKNELEDAQDFAPCRTSRWGQHREGYCQTGIGAALSTDGSRLYLGSPGTYYWQGQVCAIAAAKKLPFVPPRVIIISSEGKIYSQHTHNRKDVIPSLEGPPNDDDTYLGYAVTSGRFDGGLKAPYPSDFAVSAPRREFLKGKVVLFTYNMTIIRNVTGEQLGSYFGYALAACDVDNDGLDDLIVGAPMYSPDEDGVFETGRVYVFYGGRGDKPDIRDGDRSNRTRFGHSIACLGDVNRDGYKDFAVGAPYGMEGEQGAVYIYHGSQFGVREKYSQVIRAEDILGNPLTFGFSVAGGIDVDDNEYPDLSVGAYESDQAFLFKARPVVQVTSKVAFGSSSKLLSMTEKNCTLKNGLRVPCIKLDACLRYEGLGVEERLDFEIQIVLDARKTKSPRLAFLSEENRSSMNETVRLEKGKLFCTPHWVYLKNNIRDKLTSLDAELWYSLASSRSIRSLSSILNFDETLSAKDSLMIQKNCGWDNVCIPDLRVIASPSVEKYVLGSGKRLEIEVEIQNEGEDAFESTFHLAVPPGLSYVNIGRKNEEDRDIPIQCSPPSFNNNNTLVCDIGNPLPHSRRIRFVVILQPFLQETLSSEYNFTMSVNSTNPEQRDTVSDNYVSFDIPIWVVTELSISGSSRPVDVSYSSSQYSANSEEEITKESEIGPQVAHLYTITNKGPSEFLKAKATILWPSNTLTGEPLLYLLEEPETSGDVQCYVENRSYNVKNVKMDKKGKSFFESELESSGGTFSSLTSEQSSSSSSAWSSSSGTRHTLSQEERVKFEEEERRREEEAASWGTGDGSDQHIDRAKKRWEEDNRHHNHRNHGKLESDSYSSGSTAVVRERGRTEYSRVPAVRVDEEEVHTHHSSHSSRGGSGTGTRSKSTEQTSTTWSQGRGGGSRTETKWSVNEDGVVRNGSNVVDRRGGQGEGNIVGIADRTYERNTSRSSSTGHHRSGSGGQRAHSGDHRYNTRIEGGGITRNEADGLLTNAESSLEISSNRRTGTSTRGEQENWSTSRRGPTSGGTRKSEERRSEWNTTWTSGGRPVTSEHSSWRKEQNGVSVGSGEHSRTYEGAPDITKTEVESRLKEQLDRRTAAVASHGSSHSGGSSVNSELDHNLIGSGDTKYVKEWEENYNTTWGSSTGGKPVTVSKTSWKTEENGKVKTGHETKTYEGVPPGTEGSTYTVPSHSSGHRRIETSSGGSQWGGDGAEASESRRQSSHHESRTHITRGGSSNEESSYDSGSRGRNLESSRTEEREEERRRLVGAAGRENEDVEDQTRGRGRGNAHVSRTETTRTVTTYRQGGSADDESRGLVAEDNINEQSGSARRTNTEYRETHHGSGMASGAAEGHSSSSGHHRHWSESRSSETERNGSARRRGSINGDAERRTHASESGFSSSSHSHHAGGESSLSESEIRAHRNQGGSLSHGESERRFNSGRGEESYAGSERRTHSGSTSNVAASIGQSAGASSAFDFGAVAMGPKDGKARTYVSDLGILKNEGSERSSGSAASSNHAINHHGSAEGESRHHHSSTRERHYSFGGEGGAKDEGSDSYSSTRGGAAEGEMRYSSGRTSSHSRNYEGDPDLDSDYGSRRSGSSSSSSSSSSSWSRNYSSRDGNLATQPEDNSETGRRSITNLEDRQGFRHYRRERREADEYDGYYDEYDEDYDSKKCSGPVRCTRIICNIGALKKDQEVHIGIRSRLWVATMKKIAPHIDTVVGSEITAKVTLLPTIGKPSSKTMTKNSTEVKTKILAEQVPPPDVVPLWIVVLSAVCGALILMLLVYILYKLGFFKRNRPGSGSSGSEKTPLNRNGHYQGDEHL